ncbi:MAG: hypothetical protein QOH13_2078 [Thermoleophilaceae bacterium]|nr:hypothetical protein [Thermoleophilaceae bacterium]
MQSGSLSRSADPARIAVAVLIRFDPLSGWSS